MSGITWEGGEPRWAEEALEALDGSGVERAVGEGTYQGSGVILTTDNRVLAWAFGSCSYCDAFENLERPAVVARLKEKIESFGDRGPAEACFAEHCSRVW